MTPWIVRRPGHRLRLAGSDVLMAGPVVQNEGLDQMCMAAEVELFDEPALATTTAVLIEQLDFGAGAYVDQFAGVVNHVSAASFPHRVVLGCTGPLHRLRRAPQNDHDLSGMSDGEAVGYVLDICNITFDPDDIQDAGYALGEHTPILWQKDQPGWDVVRELDRVFGMATIEVGHGRVCRFAYDLAPDAAGIYRTYAAGVDADLFPHERERGDLDAIRNSWHVTGATWEDAEHCRLTPWAHASGDNAKLGTNVRVRGEPFQSDVIQDEALAEAVARRMMRWHNREPDTLTIRTTNDPNVGPGRVVGVRSPAYGLDLTADADATPYLVTIADRRGDDVSLTAVGGAAGDEGTVTSGVERICNRTSFGADFPGSFSPPDFGFPPFPGFGAFGPGFLPLPCEDVVASDREWSCGTTDIGQTADWTVSSFGGGVTFLYAADVDIKREALSDDLADFEFFGRVVLSDADDLVVVGVGNPDSLTDDLAFHVRFAGSARGDGVAIFVHVPGAFATDGDDSFLTDLPIYFRLTWDHDAGTLTCVACQDLRGTFTATATKSDPTALDLPYYPVLETTGGTGSVASALAPVEALTVSHDCGADGGTGILPDDWTVTLEPVLLTSSEITPSANGRAHHSHDETVPGQDWQIAGTFERLADGAELLVGLTAGTGNNVVWGVYFYALGTGLDLYVPGDSWSDAYDVPTDDVVPFLIAWDDSSEVLSLTVGGTPIVSHHFPGPYTPAAMHMGVWGTAADAFRITAIALTAG